ncbi:hypothetical protein Salat_2685000 [Sesamum alatum]|uniref:Myb/SANT-like domain-containing protein n=1 Tax=Sesamum alatum TaxID=300844 RepID=A0AAE2CBA3_9LAMI|nr:hypothetical protein Salat_2685000 [Sesamum alatum]
MNHLKKTTTRSSTSVFLSQIHATTVSMWPDGFYFQSQIFNTSRWTREMEHTFVDNLVEHNRSGLFHPDRPSIHAVMCSLYDVNKKYGMKVVYEWAQTRVELLRERYHLFCWVVNTRGIIWNAQLGFVTGPNHVWQSLLGGAPNAEDVSVVVPAEAGVAPPAPNNEPVPDGLHAAQASDAPQAEPAPDVVVNEPTPDAMHDAQTPHALLPAQAHDAPQAEPVPDDVGTPKQVIYLSDSSSESSSMWRALHEYHGSDSDADSILPPPGVPLWKRAKYSHHSPASQKSSGASSSTASNPTPVKKKERMQEVISTCGGLGCCGVRIIGVHVWLYFYAHFCRF